MVNVKQLIFISIGGVLSACNSTTELSSKDVTTYVVDQYTGNPEISLGDNFKNSVQRMRTITLPKLRKFAQGQQVRLFVTGYINSTNSNFDSLPIGGSNNNPVPTHAAYTVFKGSGFNVISGKCPRNSFPNDFEVVTSIVAYDEDVLFKRSGWEGSVDGSGSGTYDTTNWLSNSNLVVLTQLKNCSNNQIRRSVYLPLTLISMNEANSFLLFNKVLGIYYSDSTSLKASAQLDRDKASILGMMKIASELADLTTAEFDLAIYGITSMYNEQTGILKTVYADPEFDPNFAHFIFSAEYFGDDKPEIVTIPFGEKIELKLRLNHQLPSLKSGVRKLNIKLEYHDIVIYKKSLI